MGKDYAMQLSQEYHSADLCRNFQLQIQFLLANYLDQRLCIAPRHVSRIRNRQDTGNDLGTRGADYDFVAGFDFVCGLSNAPVEQNKARVTKLLSYSAARAKATDF